MGLICAKRVSQNRSTCCGRSRSSATSLMVRNASGALSTPVTPTRAAPALLMLATVFTTGVDALLEDGGWLEHHHPTRGDRYLFSGLRVATNPFPLLAHHERSERRQLHCLAPLEAVGDLLENQFHEGGRFGARQTYLLVDRLAQVRARYRFSRHRQPRLLAIILSR